MEAMLALAVLCAGLFLTVESKCDQNVCIPKTGTSQTCSTITEYLKCLEMQKKQCMADQTMLESAIDVIIKATSDALKGMDCKIDTGSGSSTGNSTGTGSGTGTGSEIGTGPGTGSGTGSGGGGTDTGTGTKKSGGAMVTTSASTLIVSLLAVCLKL